MTKVIQHTYKTKYIITLMLGGMLLLMLIHLLYDYMNISKIEILLIDGIIDIGILSLIIGCVGFLWIDISSKITAKSKIEGEVLKYKELTKHLKIKVSDHKKSYQNKVIHQFEIWQFSKSEKEIAILLLKGFSMSKIAEGRFTSEKTIRNQCASIYAKAKVKGKHGLIAFFLNEFMDDISIDQCQVS